MHGDMRNDTKFLSQNLYTDLGIKGKIILKQILQKQGV